MKSFEEILDLAKKFHSLQVLIRFSNLNRIKDENVASHSFAVVLITRLLYDFYKNRLKIDYQKLIDMSIIHDIHEVNLSDIPNSLKRENPELNELVKKLEVKIVKKVLNNNNYFVDIFQEFNDNKSVESRIVRLADCISVYIYSKNEIMLGNQYFLHVFERVEKEINSILEKLKNKELEVIKK